MSEENSSQATIMVGISLVILVLAVRLLYLVDRSLRNGEGMGLSGEGAIETIPILVPSGPTDMDGIQVPDEPASGYRGK